MSIFHAHRPNEMVAQICSEGNRRWSVPDLLHVTLWSMPLGPQHVEGPLWPGTTFTSPWKHGQAGLEQSESVPGVESPLVELYGRHCPKPLVNSLHCHDKLLK